MNTIPEPDCGSSYSHELLEQILGSQWEDFAEWMNGQTQMLCNGRRYNHETREYTPTECAEAPHGPVVYGYDFERYIAWRGLPEPSMAAVTDLQCTLADYHLSYTPRAEVVGAMLQRHPLLRSEVERYGAVDTAVRESAVEAYSEFLVGEPWPANGDGWSHERFQDFVESLCLADSSWPVKP